MGALPDVPGVRTVTSKDATYPDLVQGNNERWKGIATDGKIYLPESTADAAKCMSALVHSGIRSGELAVRSGGHCYEDHVFNPKIRAIIDVALINTIDYDPVLDCIRVGSGCTLWDVYKSLQRQWGVTLPGGSCSTVGAGGHITGGGYGLLSRKYGLTVDYLYGVELILADGSAVQVTRDNPGPWKDLLWAHTGGGGGNFGIITHFLLRDPDARKSGPQHILPAAPSTAQVYEVELPWEAMGSDAARLRKMLNTYTTWCKEFKDIRPGVLTENVFALFRIYPKLDTKGTSTAVRLTVQAAFVEGESAEMTRRQFDGLLKGVCPDYKDLPHRFRDVPWLNATQALGRGAWDWRGEYKSAYHRDLDESHIKGLIERFQDHGTELGAHGALVALDTYGGKINQISRSATAEPHRDSVLKLQYQSYWSKSDDDSAHVTWLKDTYAKVYEKTHGFPEATNHDLTKATDGCFVNYLDAELPRERSGEKPSVWDLYYGADTFKRLQAVKKLVDPHDLFHHNQSIPLPK